MILLHECYGVNIWETWALLFDWGKKGEIISFLFTQLERGSSVFDNHLWLKYTLVNFSDCVNSCDVDEMQKEKKAYKIFFVDLK